MKGTTSGSAYFAHEHPLHAQLCFRRTREWYKVAGRKRGRHEKYGGYRRKERAVAELSLPFDFSFPCFFSFFFFFFHSLHFGFRVQRGEFKFFFFYYVVFIYLSVCVSFFLSSFPCENSREKIIRNVLVVVLFRMGRFLFCAWFTFFSQCFLVEHPFIEFNRL